MNNDEIQKIGEEEESRWQAVHQAIHDELQKTGVHYDQDRKLARQLTSEIVAATNDEEKQMLASDEAVAHGLVGLRKGKSSDLASLLEQPYFARVVTEEEGRDIEFRLGTASFPKERIIDWRKGPISKLYYAYKEGEEFGESIQGRDREGRIKLRRGYDGEEDKLFSIELPDRTLTREEAGWKMDGSEKGLSRSQSHDGHLPPILSLITPDQFKLITSKPNKPMVIQGIAGSGKTTVALHRLAWLLHEDNANLDPKKTLVIMFNRALKNYVETTLPELNIEGVPILTYSQWVNQLLNDLVGPRPRGLIKGLRSLEMFKSSPTILDMMTKFFRATEGQLAQGSLAQLFQFYSYLAEQDLFWPQWDKIREILKEQAAQKICDLQDDSLLCHFIFAEHGSYPSKNPKTLAILDHIVIDEAQDFGVVEIKALLYALDVNRTVTLVGDSAQRIVMGRDFRGWSALLQDAGFEETEPIQLNVSYRTTEQIMDLATSLRSDSALRPTESSGRQGPPPTLKRIDETNLHHFVGLWIDERLAEKRKTLSAIICRWPKQAEQLVQKLHQEKRNYVRLGHRDSFDFSPGVIVTNVHQVKGLEFRNVLVIEPTETNYNPHNDEERNLLYVAVTRAERQLDFLSSHRVTPLLPPLPTPEELTEANG